ncbi:MAG: cyclopropane-fatty-acyl-phospholipid synthase family protein [Trueperaceae bacterium]|nr:cyclopropane-fatty-acyl-phospholipid synthase family protein [Trueperaceae bacterium]
MTISREASEAKERTLRLLSYIAPEPRPFAVRLWDDSTLPASGDAEGAPPATLVLSDPYALGRALQPPVDLSAGEAFVRGEIDVEGDLEVVFEAMGGLLEAAAGGGMLERLRAMGDVVALRRQASRHPPEGAATLSGQRHSRNRDSSAIRHHYDLPVDFYRLWLDRRMVYSCGYFPTGEETLDEAQEAKLDLVCRKLRLTPEHHLLDIGCGWGSLVGYAAEHYGSRATGITLAERQVEEGTRRLNQAGVADRASVEIRDYRDVEGTFDRVASIGMAEHVGREGMQEYFQAAWDRLAPGGLMMNHAISRGPNAFEDRRDPEQPSFIDRYVFPDGEILNLTETVRAAEAVGFEVRDVEDLREHYAATLRHWVANLEASWDEAVATVGEDRARIWRLFMSGSAHNFARGRLSVHQTLLGKPDDRGRVEVPPSRADLYRP